MRKIARDVKLGKKVKIYDFVNLYGCEIGDNTRIGTFVEIQKGARIARSQPIPLFRDHGQAKKYYHEMIGWNARMDGLQGAVLGVKLKHLRRWNDARRKNAQLYHKLLADLNGVAIPPEAEYAMHIYHVYTIRVKNSDTTRRISISSSTTRIFIITPII